MPGQFTNYCRQCPYRGRCSRLPLSMEDNSHDVLLIFQAPGIDEWREQRPIHSPNTRSAAARIRNSLRRIRKSRCDFSITNAVQCYPGRGSNGRDKQPRMGARRQCAEWLRRDIRAFRWRKFVVFGKIAEQSVRSLGFQDRRFRFIPHPSGRLSNQRLDKALRWATS